MNEGEEAGVEPVETGWEASEVFKLVEASFDPIARFVEVSVVRDDDLARSVGGDDRLHSRLGDLVSEGVAVIGLVIHESVALDAVDHGRRGDDVMDLTTGEHEAEGASQSVGQHMDLGGQSSSGTPQRLIFGPPFPVAACWWARTRVVSRMRYWLSRFRIRAANIRSHTPTLAQRENRVDALPLAISLRKIVPMGARAQHSEDAVDELSIIPPRSPRVAQLTRQQVLHILPLPVRKLVPLDHSLCSESLDPEHRESSRTRRENPECRLDLTLVLSGVALSLLAMLMFDLAHRYLRAEPVTTVELNLLLKNILQR
jgi:hypothetical protein